MKRSVEADSSAAFPGLMIRGRMLSAEEVCAAAMAAEGASDNEGQALDFCRRWLSGEQQFSVTTSGSTGAPKRIAIPRQAMVCSARMTAQALGLQAGDRALVCLPVNHIAGLMMLVRGMVLGLSLRLEEPRANPFSELSAEPSDAVDFVALTPLQLQTLLEAGPAALAILNGCKAVLVGGAPVSSSLLALLKPVRAPVYQTFAMTETVSHFALRRLTAVGELSAYQALPGVTIGQDRRGCLTVDSALSEGTLVTNDLVTLLPKNRFLWHGRIDNVINSAGVKVCPEQVERAAIQVLSEMGLRLPATAVFVCGVADQRLGQSVLLCLAGQELDAAQEQQLMTKLQQVLGRYARPRQILYTPQLAETANGKLDRAAARQQVLSMLALGDRG